MASDELAEINGIKPKILLLDGEEKEVSSMSSNATYKVKRTQDHFYCTCPAWRNQGKSPPNARTCKHLKTLFGDQYEEARLQLKNPGGSSKGSAKRKPPSSDASVRQKRRKAGGDGDRQATKAANSSKRQRQANDSGPDKPPSKTALGKQQEESDGNLSDSDEDAAKVIPELLLANKWDVETGLDPVGWWISEKLDGVRTYYDGKNMISRLGNPFTPPAWFLEKLPQDVTLDGELFGGRGEFQSTVSIVKAVNSPLWKNITFQIFDIPSKGDKPFEERISFLEQLFGPGGSHECEHVKLVKQEKARDRQHVIEKLQEIEALGGEGLMLRKAGSAYEGRRSSSLLKIKTFYDAEAIVTDYVPGKGRNKGSTGALKCVMESGKTFNVGTGLSDKQRKHPPKIGAIITYRFQELTRDGVPRFPSYVGEAVDKDKSKDAEIPEHRKSAIKISDA